MPTVSGASCGTTRRSSCAAVLKRDTGSTAYVTSSMSSALTWQQDSNAQLELNAAVATRFPGAERVAGIWEFVDRKLPQSTTLMADFVRATGPETSQDGRYDMTYQGLWSIWMGLFGTQARIDSLANAAWANLRSHAPSRDGSGSGASTPRRGTPHETDAEYNAAIQRLNVARMNQGHIAAPGNHRLPHTDRIPQRRMMLAVCGENHAYDTMAEVTRYVYSAFSPL